MGRMNHCNALVCLCCCSGRQTGAVQQVYSVTTVATISDHLVKVQLKCACVAAM